MKVQKMITLDEETVKQAKEKDINVSEYCNESLRYYLSMDSENLDNINIELTRAKLKKLQKQKVSLDNEIKSLENTLKAYAIMDEERKERVLLQRKKQLEADNKCKHCGLVIAGKFHDFEIGKICDGCFLSQAKGNINKWMEKK